jgi:hypothetical protein
MIVNPARWLTALLLLLAGCNLDVPQGRLTLPLPPSAVQGAPVVTITSPLPGTVFQSGVTVFIQALIANAGADIARVEIAIDGEIIETLSAPNPDGMTAFSITAGWMAQTGSRRATVTAFRASGESSIPAEVSFTVVSSAPPTSTPTLPPSATSAPTDPPSPTATASAPTNPPIPTVAPRVVQPTAETPSVDGLLQVTLSLTPPSATPSFTPTQTPTSSPTSSPTPASTSTGITVTFNQGANIRSGPSRVFDPPIRTAPTGVTVEALAVDPSGMWYRIRFQDGEGWVFRDLVTVTGDPARLPIDPGPVTPTAMPIMATNTPPQINLAIESVGLSPMPPRCNEPFTIRAAVVNSGSQPSPPSMIRVVDARAADGSIQADFVVALPTIDPGVTAQVEIPITISTWYNEEHQITLTLDPIGRLPESNEDDNRRVVRYLLDRAGCP